MTQYQGSDPGSSKTHRSRFAVLGRFFTVTVLLGSLFVLPTAQASANQSGMGSESPEAVANSEIIRANTTTTVSPLLVPTEYGTPLMLTVTVELDAPSNLSGQTVELWLDGQLNGAGMLIYGGTGQFVAIVSTSVLPKAGNYSAMVKFPGFVPTAPGDNGAYASESAPFALSIAAQPTTTAIISAPSSVSAFAPVDVFVQVRNMNYVPTGSVVLMHGATEVATASLQGGGTPGAGSLAEFTGVQLLPTGATLSVKYLGSDDGNLAPSESVAHSIQINPIDTSMSFTTATASIREDEQLKFDVSVRNSSPASTIDPSGSLEVLADGVVIATFASVNNSDAVVADGVSQFSVRLPAYSLSAGEHQLTMNFIADPGFNNSTSAMSAVSVQGISAPAAANTPTNEHVVSLARTGSSLDTTWVGFGAALALVFGVAAVIRARLRHDAGRG